MFVDKLLSLFICRGQGKINMKSWEAKIKKKKSISLSYLPLFLPCLLHDQAIHNRNVETDFFFLSPAKHATVVTNQFTISLFDVFHWGEGKQIKAETAISQIRWIYLMCSSAAQDYATKGSRTALEFECFFFFFFQRSNKVRCTKTNISDSAIVRVLEVKNKRWDGLI